MTDTELMLTVESKKKSGWLAALLNLFLPSFGYFYCGSWFLGLVALAFIAFALIEFGVLGFIFIGIIQFFFVIDGFLCAGRANRKMVKAEIAARRTAVPPATATPA